MADTSWTAFDEDGPFAGLSYEAGALEFLRRHKMRMTIRRRQKGVKEDWGFHWAFRITKSNGKFLASHFFTGDGSRPSPYDILSCLSGDMNTDEDFYEKEKWQGRLKKFFATKNVREELLQFV